MRKAIGSSLIVAVAFLALLTATNSGSFAVALTQTSQLSSPGMGITVSVLTESNPTTVASLSERPTVFSSATSATSPASTTGIVTSSITSTSSTTSGLTTSTSETSTWTTVVLTSTITTTATSVTTTSSYLGGEYSISFSPPYWFCTDILVTLTGPLIESGLYGDTLQFQYFQYNPTYPSVLQPIFTDSGLTVTSDTVSYWISYNEYAAVNFSYLPYLAVKVVDVTPKWPWNGYEPALIDLELTSITPQGNQSCQLESPIGAPEFQAGWVVIAASLLLGLLLLRVHKRRRDSG